MDTIRLFCEALAASGDATLGLSPGETRHTSRQRFRVTRRGNVYDDAEDRTVWHTHGLGTIKERIVMAQAKAEELNRLTPA